MRASIKDYLPFPNMVAADHGPPTAEKTDYSAIFGRRRSGLLRVVEYLLTDIIPAPPGPRQIAGLVWDDFCPIQRVVGNSKLGHSNCGLPTCTWRLARWSSLACS